jgi:Iron-containing redox enzyme
MRYPRSSSVATDDGAARWLQAKLGPLIAEVSVRSQMMAEHPKPRLMYRALLELMYSEVRATVPLMVAAEGTARALAAKGDRPAPALSTWLRLHITEEEDHATWILDDYARVGGDPEVLTARPGSPTIAALVGSVYYWTVHAHPVAILGYCAVLEGYPPSRTFIEHMVRATGYPEAAFETLRHHSAIDVRHGGEVFELIDRLQLDARQESIVGMAALQTADLLIVAGDELVASVTKGKP